MHFFWKKKILDTIYKFENIFREKNLEIQQTMELTQEYKSKEILDDNSAEHRASI